MLAAGAFTLAAAQVMGRRDLLTLALLLLVLPLVSLAGIRLVKPRFRVYREFNPSPVETSAPATVHLAVARTGPGSGRVAMEERLPAHFGQAPSFWFPSRSATGGTSRYEYHLTSRHRGQFRIGPVTAEFTDPFGLSLHRQAIDDGDVLTVTPAAVVLPATGLAGARGSDGVTATRVRANPSDDDIMTREYRHGDPMRRVHWPATARHGSLMVRQEESVTTPEATIILDHRAGAFGGGPGTSMPGLPAPEGHAPATSDTFEWSVVAAISAWPQSTCPGRPTPGGTGCFGRSSIGRPRPGTRSAGACRGCGRRQGWSRGPRPLMTNLWTSYPPTGCGAP